MKAFRTLVLAVALVCGGIISANAQIGGGQKIVYVDSEYILTNIPEYADAQSQIESLSSKWQGEVKALFDKVEELYNKYQTEKLLLSEDQKRAREEAIVSKEREAKNLQMQYFGSEGQLFQKRAELIQPIQEKIYTAMQEIAQQKNYAFVLDLASGTSVLYANRAPRRPQEGWRDGQYRLWQVNGETEEIMTERAGEHKYFLSLPPHSQRKQS